MTHPYFKCSIQTCHRGGFGLGDAIPKNSIFPILCEILQTNFTVCKFLLAPHRTRLNGCLLFKMDMRTATLQLFYFGFLYFFHFILIFAIISEYLSITMVSRWYLPVGKWNVYANLIWIQSIFFQMFTLFMIPAFKIDSVPCKITIFIAFMFFDVFRFKIKTWDSKENADISKV